MVAKRRLSFGCDLKVELTLLRKVSSSFRPPPESLGQGSSLSPLKWGFRNKIEKHRLATSSLSSAGPRWSLLFSGLPPFSLPRANLLPRPTAAVGSHPSAKQDPPHPLRLSFFTPSPTAGTPFLLAGDTLWTPSHVQLPETHVLQQPCSLRALEHRSGPSAPSAWGSYMAYENTVSS